MDTALSRPVRSERRCRSTRATLLYRYTAPERASASAEADILGTPQNSRGPPSAQLGGRSFLFVRPALIYMPGANALAVCVASARAGRGRPVDARQSEGQPGV